MIRTFQAFQKGGGGPCILGSGRCAQHNTKLKRQIVKNRVSVVDKTGNVAWQIREGTILVCPLAHQSNSDDGNTVILNPERGNPINKRMKISEKFVTNQPELVKPD